MGSSLLHRVLCGKHLDTRHDNKDIRWLAVASAIGYHHTFRHENRTRTL